MSEVTRLSKERQALIANDYAGGATIMELVDRYGHCRQTIERAVKKNGVAIRKCGFGGIPRARARVMQSKGGRTAQASGRGHKFTSEEALVHGRLGSRIAAEVRRNMRKIIRTKLVTVDCETGPRARPVLRLRQEVTGGPTTSMDRTVDLTVTFEEARKIVLALKMAEEEQTRQDNLRAARAREGVSP